MPKLVSTAGSLEEAEQEGKASPLCYIPGFSTWRLGPGRSSVINRAKLHAERLPALRVESSGLGIWIDLLHCFDMGVLGSALLSAQGLKELAAVTSAAAGCGCCFRTATLAALRSFRGSG